MASADLRQTILDLLQNPTLDNIKTLFWSELNYDRVNQELSRADWSDAARNALAENPLLFASGGSDNAFHILYARLASNELRLGDERPVIARLLREHPYALFLFSNAARTRWHLVNVKDAERLAVDEREGRKPRMLFRRFTIGREERLRTAAQQIAKMDLHTLSPQLWGIPPLQIQRAHDEAFDVEALTETFFQEYVQVFGDLQKRLGKQVRDKEWAHDYSLQLLNRLMFLYFIQRKRWLGEDAEFISKFWETYKDSNRPRDTFFSEWLSILFFEAFNNKFQAGRRDLTYIPQDIRNALQLAPYLNGGLFSRNLLDDREFNVPDAFFEMVFDRFDGKTPGLFERYNFTIAEDTPFDQEVAVDPEMIGKVYESLVNVTAEGVEEKEDLRGAAGIFYTPRVEIDLMCRLTLLDYLSNHLGANQRAILRDFVFAFDAEEKQSADAALARNKLWSEVNELLRSVTALDITCGSGSFIVGMLNVLDDLIARADAQLGQAESAYERRKEIIGSSLYGVDVMSWAVQVAELRLWLQLIVDTELELGERKAVPLLPNLSFKIRAGDSLVQEVGGVNFSHRTYQNIPATLKGRLTTLKNEKIKFYDNDETRKFRTQAQLEIEELALFKSILIERGDALTKQIRQLDKDIENPSPQLEMMGVEQKPQAEQLKMVQLWRDQRDAAQAQLDEIQAALGALRTEKQPPFVWDIAFVEIFEGERAGFDILVGNPPYVRQEMIAPPHERQEDYSTDKWKAVKKEYKEKLQRSVAAAYPHFFGYKPATGQVARKLDGKSDLYIYFYLYGLSLLNPRGAFCFITSNSWLDVGYGAELQEFLLKHSHVRLILDNQVKRSFKQADVNTIIALLAPADDRRVNGLDKTARFVMFKTPFENVLSPIAFGEIEEAKERVMRSEFRVIVKTQQELLGEGLRASDEQRQQSSLENMKYFGNKWGGIYLRAPDIFHVVMQKTKQNFEKLGATSWLRFGRGRRTGADDYFYLSGSKVLEFGIEKRYLRPLVKSPTEFAHIAPATSNLHRDLFIFLCDEDAKSMKGTGAEKYVKYGIANGINKANLARVDGMWWNLGTQPVAQILLPIAFNDRFFAIYNDAKFEVHQRFATIYLEEAYERYALPLAAYLNSTVVAMMAEVLGRRGLGQGALDFPPEDWRLTIIPRLPSIDANSRKALLSEWSELKEEPPVSIQAQIKTSARQRLDNVVFDLMKLTRGERDAVYEAVIGLVEARLKKADSLNRKTNADDDED